MPTFDFTSPDGKSYSVDGPDGATPDQAFQILQQHLGAPAPEGSSSATGVAKSLGVGLGEGAIGLAGTLGDVANIGSAPLAPPSNPVEMTGVAKKFNDFFGGNNTYTPGPSRYAGSGDYKKAVEGVTGEFYKSQGRPEQLANTAGQFVPALLGGPEGLLVKVGTRIAAPALASEAAGALTDDNPYAKAAGALTGALAGPAAFNRAVRVMRPANVEPTVAELKAASRSGYQDPNVAAVQIKPQAVDNLATTIESDLTQQGFRPTNQGSVFSTVGELKGATNPVSVADLDSTRKALGVVAKEKDAVGMPTANAAAAQRAVRHIDDFLPNLQQADLLAGDAAQANQILQRARANWGAAKRAENVQTLAANAELNAASANSGANIQNATKQAFKPMLKNNAAKAVGYSDDEIAALNQIVRGTWTGSAARAAGNLLGGGGGLGMLVGGAAGYHEGGLPGAIAVGLAGRGLKMIGNRSTLNAVGRLDRMLRNRSPFAVQVAAQNPQIAMQLPPAAVRRLQVAIAANPVLAAQIGQPVQGNSRQER